LRYGPPWRGDLAAQIKVERGRAAPHAPLQRNIAVPTLEDPMLQLVTLLTSLGRKEEGQDLLEYALLVALIALIAIGAVGVAGGAVKTIFTNIGTALNGA
jgi:pilus assembly protein Flp/PilA